MLGPIDYVAIGFNGSNFNGSALKALAIAADKGIIRVIDLLFVIKDPQGVITEGEYEDQSEDVREMVSALNYDEKEGMPILTDSDITKIGSHMPADSAAGVMVIEHVWAKDLKEALVKAGGFLVADGRIHSEAVETAMSELAGARR